MANHGTYGILWLLKDAIFPDKQFSYKVTAISGALSIILVLGPYWLFAYFLCSNHVMVSPAVGAIAIAVHTLGCVLMMASDAQKFYTLKYKKGLKRAGGLWIGGAIKGRRTVDQRCNRGQADCGSAVQ